MNDVFVNITNETMLNYRHRLFAMKSSTQPIRSPRIIVREKSDTTKYIKMDIYTVNKHIYVYTHTQKLCTNEAYQLQFIFKNRIKTTNIYTYTYIL